MYGILLPFAWGFIAAAQAQPVTLTLACKGTVTSFAGTQTGPTSMGIIVNFTARTVQGFGFPGLIDYPVTITAANDVTVAFSGSQDIGLGSLSSIHGSIDRVTGGVEATSTLLDRKTDKIYMY
jgi:hypothetical protein